MMRKKLRIGLVSVVVALGAGLTAACGGDTEPVSPAIAKARPILLSAVSPTSFACIVGSACADIPTVLVRDQRGNTMQGVQVSFAVVSGGGTISNAAGITDANGTASVGMWQLGPQLGGNSLVAEVAGLTPVVFVATAIAPLCADPCPATQIAFERSGRIMLAGEDGSNARELATGRTPSWAPDGSSLVYQENDRLWLIGVDGSGAKALTTALWGEDSHPVWSPDGSKVAFFRWVDGIDDSYIVVIDVTSRSERVLTGWWPLGRPSWSPDGSRIVFTCHGPSPHWESDLCVVPSNLDLGYSGGRYTENTLKIMTDTWVHSDPAWSPDGGRIAFTTDRDATDSLTYIALISPDGLAFQRLAPGHHPAWSPDGARIVFAGPPANPGLHMMNRDGTGLRRITDNPDDTSPAWRR